MGKEIIEFYLFLFCNYNCTIIEILIIYYSIVSTVIVIEINSLIVVRFLTFKSGQILIF